MAVHHHYSLCRRIIYIFFGCLQNIITGGVIYGWSSISGSLLVAMPFEGGPGLTPDYIHVMFVTAVFFSFLGPLMLGALLDSYGPRVCSIISLAFVAGGSLLFGLSDRPHLPMFIPALSMIAFGGPGAQSAIIHLSNLFPQYKATATALITGSLNLSFVVFFAFDQFWHFLNIDYRSLFIGYAALVCCNILIALLLWPDKPYTFVEQILPSTDDLEALAAAAEEAELMQVGMIRLPSRLVTGTGGGTGGNRSHHNNKSPNSRTASPNPLISIGSSPSTPSFNTSISLKEGTLGEQIASSQFVGLTMFFIVTSFWANFFIGTLDIQLGDSSLWLTPYEQRLYGRVLTITMACGCIAIPFVGLMMDKHGFPITSVAVVVFGVCWSLLLVNDSREAIIPAFVFYTLFRTFLFTFLFAYMADTMGFKYFGVLAGLMFVMAGFVSLLQYPLAAWATGTCHLATTTTKRMSCDAGRWTFVNLAMTLSLLATLSFCYSDWVRRRRFAQAARVFSERARGNSVLRKLTSEATVAANKQAAAAAAAQSALSSPSDKESDSLLNKQDKRGGGLTGGAGASRPTAGGGGGSVWAGSGAPLSVSFSTGTGTARSSSHASNNNDRGGSRGSSSNNQGDPGYGTTTTGTASK